MHIQGSCSELVMRLNIDIRALCDALLEKNMFLVRPEDLSEILEEEILTENFVLIDADNLVIPIDEFISVNSYFDGDIIICSPDSCEKLFPTLSKLEWCFSSIFQPHDGGSILNYENWAEDWARTGRPRHGAA